MPDEENRRRARGLYFIPVRPLHTSESEWKARAACAGHPNPDIFYPEGSIPKVRAAVKKARTICSRCPVKMECREAGKDEDHGIWGNLTVYQRKTPRQIQQSNAQKQRYRDRQREKREGRTA